MSELPPESPEPFFPDSSTDYFTTGEYSVDQPPARSPLHRGSRRFDLGSSILPELASFTDGPGDMSHPATQLTRSETPATFERLKSWRTGRSSEKPDFMSPATTKKNLGRKFTNHENATERFAAEIASRNALQLPEREPLETPLAYINRCLALTPEEKTALDEVIDDVRQQMAGLYIDSPEEAKEINGYAAVTRWKLAGSYQDKLPDSFYRDRSTRSITCISARNIQLFDAFMRAAEPHVERVRKLSQKHADTLTQVGVEAIQQSNTFGLLESFTVQHSIKSERPLSETERAAKESILGSEIIHDYKIFPHELGRLAFAQSESAGPAFIAYKRGLFMLDELRVPDEAATGQFDSDIAYDNLRQWALGQAAAMPEDKVRFAKRLIGQSYEDYLQAAAIHDVPYFMAENLDGENHHALLVTIIKSMVRHAFDPYNTTSYQQALSDSLTVASAHLKRLFGLMHTTLETSQATNSGLAWMRKTDCSALGEASLGYSHPKQNRLAASTNGMRDAETISNKSQKQIGEVQLDNRTPEEYEHLHLIFETPYQQLPSQSEQQPVLTVLWGSAERPFSLQDASLHIPGFIAVAARQENQGVAFDFLRNPKGSPYTNPGLPLTKEQQGKIADAYKATGAAKLSKSLIANPPKDLRSVGKIARQNSSYFIPDRPMSYSYVVREGHLLTQCQGAAELGSKALSEAGILNRVVRGAVLPQSGREITLAGHAQVITVAHDVTNIIDFTPYEERGDPLESRPQAAPPSETIDSTKANQEVTASVDQEKPGKDPQQEALRLFSYAHHSLQRTQAAFELKLAQNMNLPQHTSREIVYEKLAGLLGSNPHDFWWQTASTLVRCQTVLSQYEEKGKPFEVADNLDQLAEEFNSLALTLKSVLEVPANERRKFALFFDLSGLRSLEATAVKSLADTRQLAASLRAMQQPAE